MKCEKKMLKMWKVNCEFWNMWKNVKSEVNCEMEKLKNVKGELWIVKCEKKCAKWIVKKNEKSVKRVYEWKFCMSLGVEEKTGWVY